MRIFRRRVKAKASGAVSSIRIGARTRIAVMQGNGIARYYFVTDTRLEVGQNIIAGQLLGKI